MKIKDWIQKIKKSNTVYHTITIGMIIVVCLVIVLLFYSVTIKQNFQSEIETSLTETANQSVLILNSEINGKMNLLNEIAGGISSLVETNIEKAVASLEEINKSYHFKRIGIIELNGTSHSTDNQSLSLNDREYFQNSIKGERVISDTLIDKMDGEKVNTYSMPIYDKGKIVGVLFAMDSTEQLKKELAVFTFNGYGYTYIIKKNGDCILDSLHPMSYKNLDNIFTSMIKLSEENREEAEVLRSITESGTDGYVKFENQGSRYMYLEPLGTNDWYIVTVVSANVLDNKMDLVLGKTYQLSISLIVLFMLVIFYIMRMQKRNQRELMKIAYVDKITGGYSYAKFQLRMKEVLDSTKRKTAVLSMDIDDFKFINGAFGYKEGDKLLCFIWNILKEWTEKGELYARQTADMFVVVIFYDKHERLIERIEALCEQFKYYNIGQVNNFKIIPSIGIYEVNDNVRTQEDYLDAARIARKTVKGKSEEMFAFYDKKIEQIIYRNKEIEANMQEALEKEEFIVYYQPKYCSKTQKIVGAEALVRWKKEDGTIIPPNEFIPLFEKNGFITTLDSYVFRHVCQYQKDLLNAGITPVPVSVNLSKMHMFDSEFIAKYMEIVNQIQLPIQYIQLEITESAICDNQPLLVEVINKLHNLGFIILLDDFGTGYSSMIMLKNLNIDVLKIDKSFVDNIGNQRGNKIVDGIISLAQSLEMEITAEGVENENQYTYLMHRGCDNIQGFYFARPMPESEYKHLL